MGAEKNIDYGGPAFPVVTRKGYDEYGHQAGATIWQFGGMTLRDYFAAKAMQGMLAEGSTESTAMSSLLAACAYDIADAMIAARKAVRK